jgi:hypothetical protein
MMVKTVSEGNSKMKEQLSSLRTDDARLRADGGRARGELHVTAAHSPSRPLVAKSLQPLYPVH